jgi:hypothetical protein
MAPVVITEASLTVPSIVQPAVVAAKPIPGQASAAPTGCVVWPAG